MRDPARLPEGPGPVGDDGVGPGAARAAAAMIPEERPDGPGAGEESARLQAASSVRKVSAPPGAAGARGRGAPESGPLPPAICRRLARVCGAGSGLSRPSVLQDSRRPPTSHSPRWRQAGLTAGETEGPRRAWARVACLRWAPLLPVWGPLLCLPGVVGSTVQLAVFSTLRDPLFWQVLGSGGLRPMAFVLVSGAPHFSFPSFTSPSTDGFGFALGH